MAGGVRPVRRPSRGPVGASGQALKNLSPAKERACCAFRKFLVLRAHTEVKQKPHLVVGAITKRKLA